MVLTQELEALAILIWGGECKRFPPFKRGAQKVLPSLVGRGRKKFGTGDFPVLYPSFRNECPVPKSHFALSHR